MEIFQTARLRREGSNHRCISHPDLKVYRSRDSSNLAQTDKVRRVTRLLNWLQEFWSSTADELSQTRSYTVDINFYRAPNQHGLKKMHQKPSTQVTDLHCSGNSTVKLNTQLLSLVCCVLLCNPANLVLPLSSIVPSAPSWAYLQSRLSSNFSLYLLYRVFVMHL